MPALNRLLIGMYPIESQFVEDFILPEGDRRERRSENNIHTVLLHSCTLDRYICRRASGDGLRAELWTVSALRTRDWRDT